MIMTRRMRRAVELENNKWPLELKSVPLETWPIGHRDPKRIEVWRSRDYLVQLFDEDNGVIRMSVNSTIPGTDGRWTDGITWDELQRLKTECGRGSSWAVEIYPQVGNVVNVANMRHLWLLPSPLPIGWNKENNPECR